MSLSQYLDPSFDARNIETQSYEALQPGKYLASIEEVEVRPTQKGGAGLNIKFETLQPVQGRKLFAWINLAHPSSTKCVEIGQQELAKLSKAVGIFQPKDENEFLNKQVVLTVALDKDDATRNVVTDYASATVAPQQAVNPPANMPQAPVPQQAPAATPSPSQGGMPWSQ